MNGTLTLTLGGYWASRGCSRVWGFRVRGFWYRMGPFSLSRRLFQCLVGFNRTMSSRSLQNSRARRTFDTYVNSARPKNAHPVKAKSASLGERSYKGGMRTGNAFLGGDSMPIPPKPVIGRTRGRLFAPGNISAYHAFRHIISGIFRKLS